MAINHKHIEKILSGKRNQCEEHREHKVLVEPQSTQFYEVQIYFFNLYINVKVSHSSLMQCVLHLLVIVEKSIRNHETFEKGWHLQQPRHHVKLHSWTSFTEPPRLASVLVHLIMRWSYCTLPLGALLDLCQLNWTYSGSCTWSRPGQRWSTRLVSHRKWQCCSWDVDPVMPAHRPTELLLWGPPDRRASGIHPEPPEAAEEGSITEWHHVSSTAEDLWLSFDNPTVKNLA